MEFEKQNLRARRFGHQNVSDEFSFRRLTARDIAKRKGRAPIVALTAYSANMARILDSYVDMLLVRDSLGGTFHGYGSTASVSIELMRIHAQAVVRGSNRALVVVDMPFGSYEENPEVAFRNAVLLIKEAGCGAIGLKGGVHLAETIRYLTDRGIPVMGHIGLPPQALSFVNPQVRGQLAALEQDARAVAKAGAFAVVIESKTERLASRITRRVPIPTISVAASHKCDGQILDLEELLGLGAETPKPPKAYAQLSDAIEAAVKAYASEVRARIFPSGQYTYSTSDKLTPVAAVNQRTKPAKTSGGPRMQRMPSN